jgi:RNA polymerase sigma-70 factor (ECF subfamily)
MENDKQHIDDHAFISLITANQRRIYAYIFMLVPNLSDADDIMQETSSLMWEQKSKFTPGTDFVAWGARIAYFKVLDFRKKMKKQRRVLFLDEQFSQIEKQALERSKHVNDTIYKLQECIKKLTEPDRRLLHLKYSMELTAKEISTRIDKSIRLVFLSISRIQNMLLNCVERFEM